MVPAFFGGAYYIFLLRQFFKSIPDSLLEAAEIDGAGEVRIFAQIMLPLCKPAMASVAIFTFINTWSDFMGPMLYLNRQESYTLSIGLQAFLQQHYVQWGILMAASAIFTIDHSTDNTWCVLKELADENQEVICIDFAKNFGQPSALLAGFAVAQGDYILTSDDDDGQCPVGEVFHFWEELQKGYDVVCAKYTARHPASGFRKIGTYINEWMARAILKKPDGLALASFFMAKKFVVEKMLEYKNAYPYIAGLLLRTTTNIGNITLVQRARTSGESGYN